MRYTEDHSDSGRFSALRRVFILFNEIPYMDTAAKMLAFIYLIMQLVLVGIALWPTYMFIAVLGVRAGGPTEWVLITIGAVLIFNYAYVIALLLMRLIIPKSREGFYPRRKDGRPPREGFVFLLNAFLSMARYCTPWAWMFSSVITNTYPLQPIYRRVFGPDMSTVLIGDVCRFLDPYLVKVGRNVQFGINSGVCCHIYDHRGLTIRKVRIGDHSVIGGHAEVMLSDIGHHAVVAAHSWVAPGTVVKPYELWAGKPAKKIKDISPKEISSMPPYE